MVLPNRRLQWLHKQRRLLQNNIERITMKLTSAEIAQVCHENNRAYCESMGDFSNPPWKFVPPEKQKLIESGVEFHLANPDASPKASHEKWMKDHASVGWTWGPSKDAQKKQHPNMVPYGELPQKEKTKDYLFGAMVNVLRFLY
jgi:hypothetical protein